MTREQQELERAFLDYHRGVAWGMAWGAAFIALGEWARRCGTPLGSSVVKCWKPCSYGISRGRLCPHRCSLGDLHDGGCRCADCYAVERGTP